MAKIYRATVYFHVQAADEAAAEVQLGDFIAEAHEQYGRRGLRSPIDVETVVDPEPEIIEEEQLMEIDDTYIRLDYAGQQVRLKLDVSDDDLVEVDTRVIASDIDHWDYGFAQPLIESVLQQASQLTAGLSRERSYNMMQRLAAIAADSLKETLLIEWSRRNVS